MTNKKRSYTPRAKKKDIVVNDIHENVVVNDIHENGDLHSDRKVSFVSNTHTDLTENANGSYNGSFDTSAMELLPKIKSNFT